jgi:hypothetical protein
MEADMEAVVERLVACFERGELSRRQMIAGVAALVAAAAEPAAGEAAQQPATFRAVGLNHIALRVSDLARSRDFYIRHLGMEVMSESASSCFLRCGAHFVALFRRDPPGMDHYCYAVENYTVSGAADKLRALGIEPRVTGNRIYFPDPDGLIVQLAAPGSLG